MNRPFEPRDEPTILQLVQFWVTNHFLTGHGKTGWSLEMVDEKAADATGNPIQNRDPSFQFLNNLGKYDQIFTRSFGNFKI